MNNKPTIITISGKARHGKDTTAKFLKSMLETNGRRVLVIAYGDYVKFTAEKYLGFDNVKTEKTRTFWQQYGTEKVRGEDINFWVDTIIRYVNIMRHDYDFVIIPDCRFDNEVTRWKEYDYDIISIHVERCGFESNLTEEQKNHDSETAMDDFKFDKYLKAHSINDLFLEIQLKIYPVLTGEAL